MTKAKVLTIHNNTRFFWTLVAFCVLSVGVYVYSVNMTVRHVAERQIIEQDLAERVTRIGELEFKYISIKGTVDMNLARELGFKSASPKAFVSRTQSVALVSDSSVPR